MKHSHFFCLLIGLMICSSAWSAYFSPVQEMTYCNSDAYTQVLPTYDPNEQSDWQNNWHENDNQALSSTSFDFGSGEYVAADSSSLICYTIETVGLQYSNNKLHMEASSITSVEITTDEGLQAYAWSGATVVAPGTAVGNYYEIEPDAGELVGDTVTMTFDFQGILATSSIGGSSNAIQINGDFAGDSIMITRNCSDLTDVSTGEILHSISGIYSEGTYSDSATITVQVGDVIGVHCGVYSSAYTGTNPGSADSSVEAEISLVLGEITSTFDPTRADFDGSGRVDLADFALFASVWLWEEPVNDTCENAFEVEVDTHYTGTTEGMTEDSVWYVFTPTTSDIYTLSICDSMGDYYMVLFDGCEGDYLGETDYDCQIAMWMEAGEDYVMMIIGYEPEDDYDLYITQGADPPSNDDCSSAEALDSEYAYAEGTTLGATGGDESSCGSDDTHDVWYTFTPIETGFYMAVAYQTYGPFGGTLTIYDGDSCSSLPMELACEESTEDYVEIYGLELTSGQTYLVRVASGDSDMGPFGVELNYEGPGE